MTAKNDKTVVAPSAHYFVATMRYSRYTGNSYVTSPGYRVFLFSDINKGAREENALIR